MGRGALKSIINAMVEFGHIDQLNLPGLADERRAVFPGGIIILYASFKALGIKRMEVSDGALREGLVHDLFGRIHHEDVRSNTVSALRQRYHVDLEHIERVKETAITCLDRVAHDWELDADDDYPFFLGWAVELFEIGLDISHSQYQKHSAYIIENSDLIGFSKQEQKILATLALAHRRKIPVKAFKELPKHRMQAAIRLTILLRLAILLHRSRDPEPLPEFSLKVQDKNIEIGFTESWFESHRLTEADLLQEAEYLKPTGYLLTINK